MQILYTEYDERIKLEML